MKAAKFTLLFLACSAALPVLAQNSSPQCALTNFDQSRGFFTVKNASADAVNQQCFLTVIPAGTTPEQSRQHPAPYLVEGTYGVDLSGGGGGGGGGGSGASSRDGERGQAGSSGAGGTSAAVSRTTRYLSPGIYRLTIGTGGDGGRANGGTTENGNPTSLTNANTGQLIAGFAGAETWRQGSVAAAGSGNGMAQAGASSGQGGGKGGDGFIKLSLQTAAAPAPTGAVAQSSEQASTQAPVMRPMKKDRN